MRIKIKYIDVTKERYYHVKTQFKHVSLDNCGNEHYHLARNRWRLDNELEEIIKKDKPYWESLI